MSNLPIVNIVTYPNILLDNLQDVINTNNQVSEDYNENRLQFDNLRKALEPVLKIRNDGLVFPDINANEIPSGTIVKEVKLDIRGEKLIFKCLELQQKLLDKMYG